MRVALYARVSTTRQAQAQTIDQQLERLQAGAAAQGWVVDDHQIYRDDGYSGAALSRPGLDRLRDRAAFGELDLILLTAPDRLARKYVHQVLLIEEFEQQGCHVEFLDRPMSQDPHDQLLLQIRGAVAEYERTLIAERMRRGRLMKLRAGQLLPWTKAPLGYHVDPERPRDPAGLRRDEIGAVIIEQIFAWYLEEQATLYSVAQRLTDASIPTPSGTPRWNVATLRGILRNPLYTGTAYANRTSAVPARGRKSALLPVGPGESVQLRPPEEWIAITVPAIVTVESFALVQQKLSKNTQCASRHNTTHDYLLRALVSCGACRLSATGRCVHPGYRYYLCRGRRDALRAAQGARCTARYIPADQLDEVVWQDLCEVLTDPQQMAQALRRARGGDWLPQELQARQQGVQRALSQLDRQQARLLEAYLAGAVELAEFERKRRELAAHRENFGAQQRQLEASARQRIELSAVAESVAAFCAQVRTGLRRATFTQRRALVELLIDRVIVTDAEVEIRYVFPLTPASEKIRFCHLRKDHFDLLASGVSAHRFFDSQPEVCGHQVPRLEFTARHRHDDDAHRQRLAALHAAQANFRLGHCDCALAPLHVQLHLLVAQALREACEQAIHATLGSIRLLASAPLTLTPRGEINHLIAAHAPQRELLLGRQYTQERAREQAAIYHPDVAHPRG